MLFQALVTEFNKIGGDIIGQLWEWFTQTTAFKKPDYKFGIRYSIDIRLQKLGIPPKRQVSPSRVNAKSPQKTKVVAETEDTAAQEEEKKEANEFEALLL